MKQTTVEWLYNKMLYIDNEYDMKLITKSEYQFKRRDIIEQAKEMEKEQIIDAWVDGCYQLSDFIKTSDVEQYYNKTFKSE